MYAKTPYMIPVNPHATQEPEEKLKISFFTNEITFFHNENSFLQ